jgi:hypothetical protein
MRKRLICTLVVLGLIGQVQGAIVFLNVDGATPGEPIHVSTDESLEIEIFLDSINEPWYGVIMIEDGGVGLLTSPRSSGVIGLPPIEPPAKYWDISIHPDPMIPNPSPIGVIATTTFFSDETGEATISLYEMDAAFNVVGLVDQLHVVVPEPATLLLFAAGGLLAGRKRM